MVVVVHKVEVAVVVEEASSGGGSGGKVAAVPVEWRRSSCSKSGTARISSKSQVDVYSRCAAKKFLATRTKRKEKKGS